eukprot:GHVN01001288.1.p1 GENE.GHVN01001288.1~~GHVN01001288.1.p1  ORF type:complete len:546 (+),score=61.28 GHVN01001288.1:1929-3566(+)
MKIRSSTYLLAFNLATVWGRDNPILEDLARQFGGADLLDGMRSNLGQQGLAGQLLRENGLDMGNLNLGVLGDNLNLVSGLNFGLDSFDLGGLGGLSGGGFDLSSIRDSFQSIVGESNRLGLTPEQTANQFLLTATERFSAPELGQFLQGASGGHFVKMVRDAALRDLPNFLGGRRRMTAKIFPKLDLDTTFDYLTTKGFAAGVSPQETVDLLLNEALSKNKFDELTQLLGEKKTFSLSGLDGGAGIGKYGNDVLRLLEKKLDVKDLKLIGGDLNFGGFDLNIFNDLVSDFGGGFPGELRKGFGGLDHLGQYLPIDRLSQYITGGGGSVGGYRRRLTEVQPNEGRLREDHLNERKLREVLPNDRRLRETQPNARRRLFHGNEKARGDNDETTRAIGFVTDCTVKGISASRCAHLFVTAQRAPSKERVKALLTSVQPTVPPSYFAAFQAAVLKGTEAKSERRQLQQAFGSILNPNQFLSGSLTEIANEALAEGLGSQIAADRWLAALNSFGLPGGSVQEFLRSAADNAGFLGEFAAAAQQRLSQTGS